MYESLEAASSGLDISVVSWHGYSNPKFDVI